LSEGELP
jgi:hypothetical protein